MRQIGVVTMNSKTPESAPICLSLIFDVNKRFMQ